MKHDPKVVDDIQTLDEAKEIIKMITGNVYLNGEIYEILKEEKQYDREDSLCCI